MRVFSGRLLTNFGWPRCISSCYLRCVLPVCKGRFIADVYSRQSTVSRGAVGRCQLSAPAWTHPQPRRRYSSVQQTHCHVHKFGELHLTVGSSCDVTISSLDPHVYLEQNLVIVDDIARRLSVDCSNADGQSRLTLSESKTSNLRSGQQPDVCDIQVPIKYGTSSGICFTFY